MHLLLHVLHRRILLLLNNIRHLAPHLLNINIRRPIHLHQPMTRRYRKVLNNRVIIYIDTLDIILATAQLLLKIVIFIICVSLVGFRDILKQFV